MRTLPRVGSTPTDTGSSAPAPTPAAVVGSGSVRWPGQELLADPVLAGVLFAVWNGDPISVVDAPPGSGKSRLVALLAAGLAHKAGLRVVVAAQTRAQAVELASRIGAVSDRAGLIVKAKTRVSADVGDCRVVSGAGARWRRGDGGEILISTTARWLHSRPAVLGADVLIVDEAYQCTYADLGALSAFAPQIVAVVDPGQIAPVVTGDVSRWEGAVTGPQVPAPSALLAGYPDAVGVHRLRHSWRLGAATCALVSAAFYPQMPFTSRRPDELVCVDGHTLPEICHRQVAVPDGPGDATLLRAVAQRVRELLDGRYDAAGTVRALDAADVAVVVPHVTQAGAVRALLTDLPDVLVNTANALQGIERPVVVAVHPLAGYPQVETFASDPGRMCVTLSRHRTHLSVFIDAATVAMTAHDDPTVTRVLAALTATPTF